MAVSGPAPIDGSSSTAAVPLASAAPASSASSDVTPASAGDSLQTAPDPMASFEALVASVQNEILEQNQAALAAQAAAELASAPIETPASPASTGTANSDPLAGVGTSDPANVGTSDPAAGTGNSDPATGVGNSDPATGVGNSDPVAAPAQASGVGESDPTSALTTPLPPAPPPVQPITSSEAYAMAESDVLQALRLGMVTGQDEKEYVSDEVYQAAQKTAEAQQASLLATRTTTDLTIHETAKIEQNLDTNLLSDQTDVQRARRTLNDDTIASPVMATFGSAQAAAPEAHLNVVEHEAQDRRVLGADDAIESRTGSTPQQR